MGLERNLEKTKSLLCTPGYIWGKGSEAAYKLISTGERKSFRERKRVRLSCTVYGVIVVASSLKGYIVRQPGRSPLQKK